MSKYRYGFCYYPALPTSNDGYEIQVKKWWGWKTVYSYKSEDDCKRKVKKLRERGHIVEKA